MMQKGKMDLLSLVNVPFLRLKVYHYYIRVNIYLRFYFKLKKYIFLTFENDL